MSANPGRQTIRFARTPDGVRLAYAQSGRGPTLIKAATWLSHLEHDWDSPVWGHVLRAMGERMTFVRYDERGCGLSDWSVPELSFESWVRDLECIADTLDQPRFALLGISQGASIAIAYAARHPERVSRLVLHGGYARGRLKRPGVTAPQRDEAETMVRLAELGWGRSDDAFRQFFTTQFIPGGTREQHAWFNELERISTSPANAARFMREFNDIDVVALLPQVRCPTLVLHSRDDRRVPYEEGRLMAGGVEGAEFVTIASANHLLLEGEPGWLPWRTRVQAFLAEDAVPGAGAFDALTARQRDLLELLARGHDNAQIAAHLSLADKTVRNQVSAIFAKLQVATRAQAIVRAREAGFGRAERLRER